MHKNIHAAHKYSALKIFRSHVRNRQRGNMLLATVAILAFVVMPIAYFSLEFIRMLGAHQQQRTAIEAAAMAAARDLSKIVIEDPYYGFISLSDQAPVGTATKAGDNFLLPVQSINTLLATTRLDMIIADKFDSIIMKKCADLDYQRTMSAKNLLVQTLTKAIQPGGTARDMDGNIISPVLDAEKEYQTNLIRMTGGSSQLIPNSLKLSLGCETGLYTVTQVPQPLNIASVPDDSRNETCYKAFVNVPYKQKDFVFAGVDSEVRLLDYKLFQPTIGGLPYVIPSIVKCEAEQKFNTRDQYGNLQVRVVHSVACAQPSSMGDHRPSPGALTIDFATGSIPNFTRMEEIFSSPQIMKSPTDWLYTPPDEDSPPSRLVEIVPPSFSDPHPPFGVILTLGVYDWIRRQGSNLNVASLFAAFKTPFPVVLGSAREEQFQADAQGMVQHLSIPLPAKLIKAISHHQLYSRSGITLLPGGNPSLLIDMYMKDNVYQPGRIQGGIHAGEPLGVSNIILPPPAGIGRYIDENNKTYDYPNGPNGGLTRPEYLSTGDAVNLLFNPRGKTYFIPVK